MTQISWDSDTFSINHSPVYLRGVAKHEDSNIRGRGLDLPLVTRDFNLMKWLGGNVFRTSHYPYAEEILDFADRFGILVISECPGVNLEGFAEELRINHEAVMDELVARDKNHASVVMWSIGNEPRSENPLARDYFQSVADHTRALDPTRPITLVVDRGFDTDQGSYAVDIISINRFAHVFTFFKYYNITKQKLLIVPQILRLVRGHW